MDRPSEKDLQEVYQWVDTFPLSRPKRDIKRDFADAINMSEIVKFTFPRLIDLHNYSPSNSYAQKTYNWNTLNQKAFKKMGFQLTKDEIESLVTSKKWSLENVLIKIQRHMSIYSIQMQQRKATKKVKEKQRSQIEFEDESQDNDDNFGMEKNLFEKRDTAEIQELLSEKDRTIQHYIDKNEILELKVEKLQQLLDLKDAKIASLEQRLNQL